MNRFLTIGIASTLALASIAGAASAAGTHERDSIGGNSAHDNEIANPDAIDTSGSGMALHFTAYSANPSAQTDRLIRHWKSGPFDVVAIDSLDDTGLKGSLRDLRESKPRQVASLQSSIEHNHALSSRLRAQNVEIGNIIDAQTAINGGITFYVQ